MMPQWDFLNFLAEKGKQYPGFHLNMQTEATDLIFDAPRIVGLTARSPQGWEAITADVVICADGRGSHLRQRAGLEPVELGAPMDVLWVCLPRSPQRYPRNAGPF